MANGITYLTGKRCENTHLVNARRMLGLGLKYQTRNGFYPLVTSEVRYVSRIATPANGIPRIRYGHAVLFSGKKWLSPAAEYPYAETGEREPRGAAAKRRIRALAAAVADAERARAALAAIGGQAVVLPDEEAGMHVLLLLAPPEKIARAFPDFASWRKFVEGCLR